MVAGVVVVITLSQVLVLLALASLIAVMLYPMSMRLERFGLKRGWSTLLVGCTVLVVVGGTGLAVVPTLMHECRDIITNMPKMREQALSQLQGTWVLKRLAPSLQQQHLLPGMSEVLQHAATLGTWLLDILVGFVLMLVVAVLLAAEADTIWSWFLPYIPASRRQAAQKTAHEATAVVFAYVAGNVLTSAITTVATFAILKLCGVHPAMVLAVLAGIFDFIPVVGLIGSMVPAMLFAFLISPLTALVVGGCYLLYHVIENYVIVPMVYGHHMRLSSLTVLLALCAGEALGGIVGIIIALPLAALYPVIEHIWFSRQLGSEVVATHQRLMEEDP